MNLLLRARLAAGVSVAVLALVASACGADDPDPDPTSPEPKNAGRTAAPPDKTPRGLPPRAPAGSRDGQASPFDIGNPEVGNLDPDLLRAVQDAADAAQADGVQFWITSGWRSRTEQQQLLDAAVTRYGTLEEALRWASTPDTSAHVTGDAVDIGPTDADSWLSQHGSDYGLCQVFANEIWHFELATTPGGTCPEMLPDSSYR